MTSASTLAPSRDLVARVQFKTILLPTDFSEASRDAALMAGRLTTRYSSKLFVVHALWDYDSYWCDTNFPLSSDERLCRKDMAKFASETGLNHLAHAEIFERGAAVDVVHKLCREEHIELIVLGTGGAQGAKKLLLGSSSEQIFRTAECPVLTLGPNVRPEHCTGDFNHILFATDFEPESAEAFCWATAMASFHGAHLTLLHVIPTGHSSVSERVLAEEERIRARMLNMVAGCDVPLPHVPEILVETGHAAEEIVKIAIGNGADLIVMGVHPSKTGARRSFALGGHAYPVSVNAHCPVLTVRPE